MHILLLNMLIAMMGNTYHKIISKSEKEYKKQVCYKLYLKFNTCIYLIFQSFYVKIKTVGTYSHFIRKVLFAGSTKKIPKQILH